MRRRVPPRETALLRWRCAALPRDRRSIGVASPPNPAEDRSFVKRQSSVSVCGMSHLAQILMDELNRDRAFAHTRGDAFHRAMPYVADHKDSRERCSPCSHGSRSSGHSCGRLPDSRTRSRPAQKKSARRRAPPRHPASSYRGMAPIKMNSAVAGTRVYLPLAPHSDRDALQPLRPLHRNHSRVVFHGDVRRLLDLIDQVLRHGSRERSPRTSITTRSRVFREIHRGLPRGISAAHDVHVFILTGDGLRRSPRHSRRPHPETDRRLARPACASARR